MEFIFIYKNEINIDLFIKYLTDNLYCKIKRRTKSKFTANYRYGNDISVLCVKYTNQIGDYLRGYKVNGIFIEKDIEINDILYYQLLINITPYNIFGFDIRKLDFDNEQIEYS